MMNDEYNAAGLFLIHHSAFIIQHFN